MDKKKLQVRLDMKKVKQLEKIAREKGVSVSEVLRIAIDAYLNPSTLPVREFKELHSLVTGTYQNYLLDEDR